MTENVVLEQKNAFLPIFLILDLFGRFRRGRYIGPLPPRWNRLDFDVWWNRVKCNYFLSLMTSLEATVSVTMRFVVDLKHILIHLEHLNFCVDSTPPVQYDDICKY